LTVFENQVPVSENILHIHCKDELVDAVRELIAVCENNTKNIKIHHANEIQSF
jgi:hypothetical protein